MKKTGSRGHDSRHNSVPQNIMLIFAPPIFHPPISSAPIPAVTPELSHDHPRPSQDGVLPGKPNPGPPKTKIGAVALVYKSSADAADDATKPTYLAEFVSDYPEVDTFILNTIDARKDNDHIAAISTKVNEILAGYADWQQWLKQQAPNCPWRTREEEEDVGRFVYGRDRASGGCPQTKHKPNKIKYNHA